MPTQYVVFFGRKRGDMDTLRRLMATRRVTDAAIPLNKPKNRDFILRQKGRERERIRIIPQNSTDFAQTKKAAATARKARKNRCAQKHSGM